jgi:hypothetical protein
MISCLFYVQPDAPVSCPRISAGRSLTASLIAEPQFAGRRIQEPPDTNKTSARGAEQR